ncbi:uncharacterized protein [Diabrotica undecimpunctata]|uniref:uncharacterized protein isoform X2 n=1 Tax=Diabrotica undecimpunctata TaxID=50387 RepID=UPI003B63476C
MMCKLVLVTLAVYLCLEAASGQHATGFNPNQNRPHATGLNPNQNRPHATGFNPNAGRGRHNRDLTSTNNKGPLDHPKVLEPHANSNGPAHPGLPLAPGPVIHPH